MRPQPARHGRGTSAPSKILARLLSAISLVTHLRLPLPSTPVVSSPLNRQIAASPSVSLSPQPVTVLACAAPAAMPTTY